MKEVNIEGLRELMRQRRPIVIEADDAGNLSDAVEAAYAERDAIKVKLLTAEHLADEVTVLVIRKVIDSRSPAGDALLDYRDPPSTPRADRLATLELEADALRGALEGTIRWASALHGPCWCTDRPPDERHSGSCLAARAVFAGRKP